MFSWFEKFITFDVANKAPPKNIFRKKISVCISFSRQEKYEKTDFQCSL